MGPSDSSARRSLTPRGSARRRKKSTTRMPRAAPLSGASANSSSPKRRAIRRILARRSKEWGRALEKRQIYQNCAAPPDGADSALAGGFQPLDALLDARSLLAQGVDFQAEFLRDGGPHQQRLFLDPVFREVLGESLHGLAVPLCESLAAGGEPVSDDIAEHAREVLLVVPAQPAEKLVDGARQVRGPLDLDMAARGIVPCEQERQGAGLELDEERACRFAARRPEHAALLDRDAQVRKRRAADFDNPSGERPQPLRGPGLLRQQVVQADDRPALEHGAAGPSISGSAGSRRAASPRTRSPACTGSRFPRRVRPRLSPLRASSRRSARSPNADRLRTRARAATRSM